MNYKRNDRFKFLKSVSSHDKNELALFICGDFYCVHTSQADDKTTIRVATTHIITNFWQNIVPNKDQKEVQKLQPKLDLI